jgi:hypothetical protein
MLFEPASVDWESLVEAAKARYNFKLIIVVTDSEMGRIQAAPSTG